MRGLTTVLLFGVLCCAKGIRDSAKSIPQDVFPAVHLWDLRVVEGPIIKMDPLHILSVGTLEVFGIVLNMARGLDV